MQTQVSVAAAVSSEVKDAVLRLLGKQWGLEAALAASQRHQHNCQQHLGHFSEVVTVANFNNSDECGNNYHSNTLPPSSSSSFSSTSSFTNSHNLAGSLSGDDKNDDDDSSNNSHNTAAAFNDDNIDDVNDDKVDGGVDKPEGSGAPLSPPPPRFPLQPSSRKYTLTAKTGGDTGGEVGGGGGGYSGSGGSGSSSITLALRDLVPCALHRQSSSLASLRACFSALQSDVRHLVLRFRDDMSMQHQLVALGLEKLRCLRSREQQQQQRRRPSSPPSSSRSRRNSDEGGCMMSDILAAEKRSGSGSGGGGGGARGGGRSLLACRSSSNATPLSSRLSISLPTEGDNTTLRQQQQKLLTGTLLSLRTFPTRSPGDRGRPHCSSSSRAAVVGPLEVVWQFSFSTLKHAQQQQQQQPWAVSDSFSFADQAWRLVCLQHVIGDAVTSPGVTSRGVEQHPAVYDIKLLALVSKDHNRDGAHDNEEDEQEQEAGGSSSSSSSSSDHHGSLVDLKCEFRLLGRKLLGKPIIRKLYTDTGTTTGASTATHYSPPSTTSPSPRGLVASGDLSGGDLCGGGSGGDLSGAEREAGDKVATGGGGQFLGADRHAIDEAMLERFLTCDNNLVVSALLMVL
jgi:hypothetical protein